MLVHCTKQKKYYDLNTKATWNCGPLYETKKMYDLNTKAIFNISPLYETKKKL